MSRGTQKGVWTLLMVITPLVGGVMSVRAQQSEPSEPSSASLQRIRSALQSPQHLISSDVPLIAPSKPDEVQLGALTFLAPDRREWRTRQTVQLPREGCLAGLLGDVVHGMQG
jgi:hypothetical protein